MYIFYNEKLKVMGMSNDENSLEFPYIEVPESYHSSTGFDLIRENGKIKVKSKAKLEVDFKKVDDKHMRNKQFEEWRKRVGEAKDELKSDKITLKDLKQFILKYL